MGQRSLVVPTVFLQAVVLLIIGVASVIVASAATLERVLLSRRNMAREGDVNT